VYQLTKKGQRALATRRGEWRDFARAVHAVVDGVV
jgi:DNA-binding PadR family transcriptional regulator